MNVISNSSPIIALSSIGKEDLFSSLFNKTIIPQGVYDEVFDNKIYTLNNNISLNFDIIKLKNPEFVNLLNMRLGPGESEAIALAIEQSVDRIILDDREARKVAESLGLRIIGTVGLLLLAQKKGFIDKVKPLIYEMVESVNFRISKSLIDSIDE